MRGVAGHDLCDERKLTEARRDLPAFGKVAASARDLRVAPVARFDGTARHGLQKIPRREIERGYQRTQRGLVVICRTSGLDTDLRATR